MNFINKFNFNQFLTKSGTNNKITILFILSLLIRVFIMVLQILFLDINRDLQFDNIETILLSTIEPYPDYKLWYQLFAENFVKGNWIPYNRIPFIQCGLESYQDYLYLYAHGLINPPLFLYVITIPALIDVSLVFVPLLLADILLPFVIYKFVRKFLSQKLARWAFLLTCFSPLLILYTGGLLLNTSLITLFFIIALYYIASENYSLGVFFLGIAVLFKTIVIFFILPCIVYISLKSRKKRVLSRSLANPKIHRCEIFAREKIRAKLRRISCLEVSKKKNRIACYLRGVIQNLVNFIEYISAFLKYLLIFLIVLFIGSLPWI
ncbi:MAG: glycosyltransferase family 39 protein, partial [Candidatus Lokiarchaeota archaeon]|nr:glycosyltransferase family 39 protein [Candidatus Lokiarchaeota archaeon]